MKKNRLNVTKSSSNAEIINVHNVTKENITKHYSNWPQVPSSSFRILVIGASRSRKANSLFNLSSHQLDIYKIHLYTKDGYEA